MKLEVWCQTDIGLKRKRNEDAFLVDRDLGLYIVADGMGGHRGGDLASRLAVETVREVVAQHHNELDRFSPHSLLREAYTQASHAIFDKSHIERPELRGMGTTLVVAFYHEGTLYIGNVGDSRAYLHSKPHLWQLTEDHSLVNDQLRMGLISEDSVESFAAKNVITRSVGFERDVECDIVKRELRPGELVLMCSDGLTTKLSDNELNKMCRDLPPEKIVAQSIDEAKNRGGEDNITCMVIFLNPSSSP